jgi:hypothetical protein
VSITDTPSRRRCQHTSTRLEIFFVCMASSYSQCNSPHYLYGMNTPYGTVRTLYHTGTILVNHRLPVVFWVEGVLFESCRLGRFVLVMMRLKDSLLRI